MKIKCPETGAIVEAEACEPYKKRYPPIVRNILTGKEIKKKNTSEKPNFGVSRLVKDCMRQAYYELVEEVVYTPEKLWILERGHAIHEYLQKGLATDEKEVFKKLSFPLFNVIGFIDAIHDGILYEFKTTADIPLEPQTHHILQVQGYYSMLSPEEQKKVNKILIVYVSLKDIKTFEVPRRDITPYLESQGVRLVSALSKNIPPIPSRGWMCQICEFRELCDRSTFGSAQKTLTF